MYFIIQTNEQYAEDQEVIFVEAPPSFESWFRDVLVPLVHQKHHEDPSKYMVSNPYIVGKATMIDFLSYEHALTVTSAVRRLFSNEEVPTLPSMPD